jgi:hypothetical protein
MAWLLAVRNDHGWGNFPGQATNLERACDGVDTLVKYRVWREGDARALLKLWGYVPDP